MGYKHMSHIYENPDLKFSEIKDIFIKASEGSLEGTEKTDGQNMLVSYSVTTGEAKASRNNSMLSGMYSVKGKGKVRRHPPGGVNAIGWAEKWAEHPSKTVRAAFVEAFEIFETAARSLSPEEQEQAFGDGINYLIFYNCEVQDPRNMNTIRYDKKTLTIHRVGHLYVDLKSGTVKEDIDVTRYAVALQNSLRTMQKSIENSEFSFEINAIRQLKGLSDKKILKSSLQDLENIINKVGLSDSQTVGEYTITRLISMIRPYIELPEDKEKMLLKKILGHKGLNINLIKKDLQPEDKESVSKLYSDRRKLLSTATRPIETVIHNFSVEVLKSFESAFVLNQDDEIQRLRKVVQQKVKEVETSGQEKNIEVLMKNMEKLQKIENISTAAEGFVFDYDGQTYKFTGNFAPINQILGLGKYSRGSEDLDPMKEESIIAEEDNTRIITVLPGKFKPPHRGHLNMVKHYANISDIVKILVSPLPRKEENIEVNVEDAITIWNIYIRDSGLSNVEAMRSSKNSPVGAAFDFVANESDNPEWAQPGDKIILGASTKGGDESRFAGDVQRHAREGVEVLDPLEHAFRPVEENPFNASDFRAALNSGEDVYRFFPEDSIKAGSEQEIMNVLTKNIEKKTLTMEFLFSLVERCGILKEVNSEKQVKEMCASEIEEGELEEMSSMSAGAVEIGAKSDNKSLIREEDLVNEIIRRGFMVTDRHTFIGELKLRGLIREAINIANRKKQGRKKQIINEEKKLRSIIRGLIKETTTPDNDPAPHKFTGINVLEDLLKKIIPVLEVDYKKLTTNDEQRDSFRSHVIKAVEDTLAPAIVTSQAQITEDEDVNITVDDDRFIDIDKPKTIEKEEPDEREVFGIDGAEETGRNVAFETFKKISANIIDSYDVLSGDEDKDLFYDYLITNLKLYFDKFENDLVGVKEPTTDEYETQLSKDLNQGQESIMEISEEELKDYLNEEDEEKLSAPPDIYQPGHKEMTMKQTIDGDPRMGKPSSFRRALGHYLGTPKK